TAPIHIIPSVLIVHPALPVQTVKDVIALARARPDTLLMASPGMGSNGHLTGELFQSMAKVRFVHVPYKGGGAASVDLISGQVQLGFEPLSTPLAHIRAGKLRAIAVTSRTRSVLFPAMPTIDESGVRGFESTTSTVLALPAATPKEAVQKVREALLIVLDQPRTRQSFEKLGGEVIKSTPEEYVRRMQEEHARWTRIRKETGIKVE
ncbi:MAG TPA: tripartite tricarboxylate transporter substrate-binding protein, partial [Burkholderiales bacterium]|nr:tripartite tricarboxylate transporter substrate-binding protein [Burkholderiales bacterium]